MNRLHQIFRRSLPPGMKFWLKQLFPKNAKSIAQIALPPWESVEKALGRLEQVISSNDNLQRSSISSYRNSRASIVMLTRNNCPLTCLCLESLYRYTISPQFDLLIIDNASEDETQAYLQGVQSLVTNLQVVFNLHNQGFAKGNNLGIIQSWGDYVILLNNDVVVTPGWLSRLIEHLQRDSKIGMVGPVTNSAGNEQMIQASYQSLEELEAFARQRAEHYRGQAFEIDMLAMFCVVFRRRLLDEVGLLDERFELGTFEDDDFCYRVKSLGYKLLCAEDVFVHHFGKGTMRELGDEAYLKLFEQNRKKFEQKWGVRWRPHQLRYE